jgi:ApaG protein
MAVGSDARTRHIRVQTRSVYLPERSDPSEEVYYFAYTIRITNEGLDPAKLINRHWVITDALGRVEEVRGPGVIGKQPRLEAGESFQYSSACPLPTRFGIMSGEYEMRYDNGEAIDVEIAPFELIAPMTLN